MKIVKMVKFDRDDSRILNRITELCNMAASFFSDDRLSRDYYEEHGLRAIMTLSGGHPLEQKHLQEAERQVRNALERLKTTEPHSYFPKELKASYTANLENVLKVLSVWNRMLIDDTPTIFYSEL